MKQYFYTTVSGGDGSAHVEWFESRDLIDMLEDHDPEYYGMGEGGNILLVNGTIENITVRDLASVQAQINGDDY